MVIVKLHSWTPQSLPSRMLRIICVLVLGPSSLVHDVQLVLSGRTLLYFVNYSVLSSLSEDSAGWDLVPWKD